MAKNSESKLFKPSNVMSATDFKDVQGSTFGGALRLLDLEIGEAVRLKYAGFKIIHTDLGEATSHMAEDVDGNLISLPLATIFQSNFQMAHIEVGQEFLILREPDVTGKKGYAKGKEMENYAIKKLS